MGRKGKKKEKSFREYTKEERLQEIQTIRDRMNIVGLNSDSFPSEFIKIEIIFRLFIDVGYEYDDMIPMGNTGRSMHLIFKNNNKYTALAILKRTDKKMAEQYDTKMRMLEKHSV
jgi:hypothetical protein